MGNYFSRKEIIYAVYQAKSFSKAAKKLFISQPSLSAMIKKMEEDMGVTLFDRTSKPIRVTEAGMQYIKTTEAIQRHERVFENYLSEHRSLQTGSLTLGCNQLMSTLVLPKYISEFVKRYPHISIHLVDDNSVALEDMITNGELDFVIDNQGFDDSIFEQKLLKQERLFLAVPASFACNAALANYGLSYEEVLSGAETAAPPLEAFGEISFVTMTKGNDTRNRSDEILRKGNAKFKTILEIDRLVTLYNFVEMGTAAAVVSDTLVQNIKHHLKDVVFYCLDSKLAKRNIYISYKKNRYYSKAMDAFLNMVMEMIDAAGL